MRIHKYLAQQGVASRRRAEELVTQGRVKVNGAVITQLGTQIESTDLVEVDGRRVEPVTQHIYLVLNKPSGVITSVRDTHDRPTVLEYISAQWQDYRLFPVGRLDYDTEGLLILTNDGDFTYKLTHPRFHVPKTYLAQVKGEFSESAGRLLARGVLLDDGPTQPAQVRVLTANPKSSLVEIVLTEGRKRQVKRMCSKVGYPVIKLVRTHFGELSLKGLGRGETRELTADEVAGLLSLACKGGA